MKSSWRVACVRIPRFPIGAVWSDDVTHLPGRDARDDAHRALSDGPRVRMVSSAARMAGVEPGMTLSAARAAVGDLDLRPWDDRMIARAVTRVTAQLVDLSPQVTAAAGAPGVWWIGASGFEKLGGERTLLKRLLALAQKYHPRSRVASADTCIAAHVATMLRWPNGRSAHLVPPGGSARLLRRAPLTLIPMDDELRAALSALGLTTAGAMAALPAGEVERRWGSEGLRAWRLARGEDDRRPVLAVISAAAAVTVELPDPVTSLEPVPLPNEQGDLLRATWRDPAAMEGVFARLRAGLGMDVVVRRRHGRPAAIRWEGRRWVVTRAIGPEHLAGAWWDQPYDREYWHCDTPRGSVLLYHARGTGRWWVEGWGD